MTVALYISGGPGVGKSSLMSELMKEWTVDDESTRLTEREMMGHFIEHEVLGSGLYIGKLRSTFPGTDALGFSVQKQAIRWALEGDLKRFSVIFGEGLRLANEGFILALSSRVPVTLVHLVCDDREAFRRRLLRGTKQNEAWSRGVFTQAYNLSRKLRGQVRVVELDSTERTPEELAGCVW